MSFYIIKGTFYQKGSFFAAQFGLDGRKIHRFLCDKDKSHPFLLIETIIFVTVVVAHKTSYHLPAFDNIEHLWLVIMNKIHAKICGRNGPFVEIKVHKKYLQNIKILVYKLFTYLNIISYFRGKVNIILGSVNRFLFVNTNF